MWDVVLCYTNAFDLRYLAPLVIIEQINHFNEMMGGGGIKRNVEGRKGFELGQNIQQQQSHKSQLYGINCMEL